MSQLSIYGNHNIKKSKQRSIDYQEVYKLRDEGRSLQFIQDALKISLGTVQHAIMLRKKGKL